MSAFQHVPLFVDQIMQGLWEKNFHGTLEPIPDPVNFSGPRWNL